MLLYTPPKVQTRIPLIDLTRSFSAGRVDRMTVADEIHKAARETGFFYVANHGIDAPLVAEAFSQGNRFFDLPLERKSAIQLSRDVPRGYDRLGGQMLDKGSPGDLKESFNFVEDLPPDHPHAHDGTFDVAPNQWPDGLPGFREALLSYYRPMTDLGLHLMRLLALSLDIPEDFFDAAYRFANPSMRLHRYPPQPQDAAFNQLGAGAHTDWGVITLLAQDDNGGLEVENAAGDWLRADPIPGTFVVNLGDMIARWTNGLYHSNMHRVMNNVTGRNRHSIVLFYNPVFNTRVEVLPTCIAVTGPPKYDPCTAGEHINERRLVALGVR
jgi:isopenicillin N synthase-like dioxygenase